MTRAGDEQIQANVKLAIIVSTHAVIHNYFNLDRHINHRQTCKSMKNAALFEWRQLLAG